MTPRRRVTAPLSRSFGRRAHALTLEAAPSPALPDELRLFALTFAGGFLFMTVFLA